VVAFTPDAVSTFIQGDIIGAFTLSGLCAGITEVNENGVGLTLYGDDIYTAQTDGFVSGEVINYKLYQPATGQISDLDIEYEPTLDNSGLFRTNGLSAITGVTLTEIGTVISNDKTSIIIYPNPSPGIFNISGKKSISEIDVFNAYGEKVLTTRKMLPGKIDLSGQPKGVYFIRIIYGNKTHFEKLIIN